MGGTDHKNEAGGLGPEDSHLFGEGGQVDLRLEAAFVEIRSKGLGSEPDWISFEKRLLNVLAVENQLSQKEEAAQKPSLWHRFRFPILAIGGLAACLVVFPFVWSGVEKQQSFQREMSDAESPLSSGIPLAREEELEKEAEADDMAAELLGVSADAFLYGEKSVDDIKWKPAKPASSKEIFGAKAPVEALPDAPSDEPKPPSTKLPPLNKKTPKNPGRP